MKKLSRKQHIGAIGRADRLCRLCFSPFARGANSNLAHNPIMLKQEDKRWILLHSFIPTEHFTILEPRDQEIDEFYAVQERRATDFEAQKL